MTNWTDNKILPIVLLKIYCENNIVRYATIGSSTTEGAFLEKLLPPSSMKRTFDILGYSFRSNRATIQIENASGELSRLLHEKSIYGRKVEIYAGIEGMSYSQFLLTFNGRVLDRSIRDSIGQLSFFDVKPNLPNIPLGKLSSVDFSSLDSAKEGNPSRYIAGKIAHASDNTYRVQLINVGTTGEYLVCSGRAIEVTNVYVDGTLKTLTTHYTKDHANYGEKIGFYVLVKFTAGNYPTSSQIVTANVRGMGYDYVRMTEDIQEVVAGYHVIDSYACDFDGSTEGVYYGNSPSVMSGYTEWAMEVRLIADALVDDDPIAYVNQSTINRGFKLCFRANGTIRLYTANASGGYNTLTTTATISTGTKVRIKFGVDSSWIAWIRIDTGSGFGSAVTQDISSSHYSSLPNTVFSLMYEDNSFDPADYSDGKMDYAKVSNDGDQNNTSDLTTLTHSYLFEQNLNDSTGSKNLSNYGITIDDFVEFDGHDVAPVYRTFFPRLTVPGINTSTIADWSTDGKVTIMQRIRTQIGVSWNYSTTAGDQYNTFMLFIHPSIYGQFNVVNNTLTLWARNGDNSGWVQVLSSVLTYNPYETDGEFIEFVYTFDLVENGKSEVFMNNELIASNTFTVRSFGSTSSDWGFTNGTLRCFGYTDQWRYPDQIDVDILGLATVYVGDRKLRRPTEDEFANDGFFYDLNSAGKSGTYNEQTPGHGSFAQNATLDLYLVDGYTGSLIEGAAGTHQYLNILNTPPEDIRDILYSINEPVKITSIVETREALKSLVENLGSGNKGPNDEGQWGGLCAGSARELLRLMTMCIDSQLYQRREDNTWVLKRISFGLDTYEGTKFNDLEHIQDRGFSINYQSDLKNFRTIRFVKNISGISTENTDDYLRSGTAEIETSANRLGEWYYDEDDLELYFIREAESAKAVSLSILRKQASEIPTVQFNTSLRGVNEDISNIILLTHSDGPGDKAGYGLKFHGDGSDRIFGITKAWPGSATSITFQFRYIVGNLYDYQSMWVRGTGEGTRTYYFFLNSAGTLFYRHEDTGGAANISLGTYAEGDIVEIKLTYRLFDNKYYYYKKNQITGLWEEVANGTHGKTMYEFSGSYEGTGSKADSSTSNPTSGTLHYMKISYSYQPSATEITDIDVDFSFDEAKIDRYITKERKLLLLLKDASPKNPIVEKWRNAGCTDKPFAIKSIGYNFASGISTIEAVGLDIEGGGTFTLNESSGGSGGGGGNPPPPPVYEYDEYTLGASYIKWVYDYGGLPDTPRNAPVYHGTDTVPANTRAQYNFNIPSFVGDVVDAKVTFQVIAVNGSLNYIDVNERTVDIGSITTPNQGIGTYYGNVAAGTGSKVVVLSASIYDLIETKTGSTLKLTHQATDGITNKEVVISAATLWFKVRRTI